MITFLGQEMWGPLPLTFLGQEMLSCHVSCINTVPQVSCAYARHCYCKVWDYGTHLNSQLLYVLCLTFQIVMIAARP